MACIHDGKTYDVDDTICVTGPGGGAGVVFTCTSNGWTTAGQPCAGTEVATVATAPAAPASQPAV